MRELGPHQDRANRQEAQRRDQQVAAIDRPRPHRRLEVGRAIEQSVAPRPQPCEPAAKRADPAAETQPHQEHAQRREHGAIRLPCRDPDAVEGPVEAAREVDEDGKQSQHQHEPVETENQPKA